MSTALAIAGVTAVLRDMLNDGLINHNISAAVGSTVSVTAVAPDRIATAPGSENSQINLFMHQVTPNLGWRNERLPSRDASGTQRLSNPPLALDLHYLVSAYGAEDLHADILLGYAMQLLHENPVLSRDAINTALSPSPSVGAVLPPALRALADCGLADQVEHIRITPSSMNTEEMSRLWSALQAHYRPSAAYLVSVVLIESVKPALAALPVLTRGPVIKPDPLDDSTWYERGVVVQPSLLPPLPTINEIVPPGEQPVARLDEPIDLRGYHLDGSNREVVLRNERFELTETLGASNASVGGLLQFVIPAARAADFPVGVYQVAARLVRPGETAARDSNRMALVLAPHILGLPMNVPRDAGGTASFSISFQPQLRAGQSVSLLLGQQEFAPQAFTAPVGTLDFVIANAPLGDHLARLRIDGIDSPIIDRAAEPPVFFNQRINIT